MLGRPQAGPGGGHEITVTIPAGTVSLGGTLHIQCVGLDILGGRLFIGNQAVLRGV